MAGEMKTLIDLVLPRLDRMEARLDSMNDWMHEIKGGLRVTAMALGVVIALLIKVLGG